jgi:kynurenine formamidase
VSGLYLDLYLDEDVDVLVAKLVRARGFDAATTQESDQIGNTDQQQLNYATEHHKTLLTHNRVDFENLARDYVLNGRSHHGIIIAVRRSPYDLVGRLLTILNTVAADEIENQVRYI